MENYFRGAEQRPYHLSIGAVLQNNEGLIACHHFDELVGMKNVYILMRETIEPHERIEEALHRGLKEEFGAVANLNTYIGSFTALVRGDRDIQKTTLYFLCNLKEIRDEWRKADDEERDSHIEWHTKEFLIEKMKNQGAVTNMADLDESEVLERLIKVYP
jgi:ADP-ribose pyrophosphatase YjhB (NUDIX family)